MLDYEPGRPYTFKDYKIRVKVFDRTGKQLKNPSKFTTKKTKAPGYSIRVSKEMSMGVWHFVEVRCFDEALDKAISLKLRPGEHISFHGIYKKDPGEKVEFEKVDVNGFLQIERYLGKSAQPSEI